MAALDAAGHFLRDNNNNNNSKDTPKKGTVNVAAGAGKDGSGDESEDEATKAKDSSASEVAKDMTIGELLRLTGHTTIGMSEVDGIFFEEDGSWDGDVLANILVGICQVQDEKPVKATVVNKEWLVQDRRGTNPLKVKTKAAKSQKAASSLLKECDTGLAKRHKKKPAWVLESYLRGKSGPRVSGVHRVRIKECDKESKTKRHLERRATRLFHSRTRLQ